VVVTLRGGLVTVILSAADVFTAIGVCESVTVTVKFEVPGVPLGVPEMIPLLLSVKPAGRLPPVTAQLYGGTPPVASSIWLYAVPSDPPGNVVVAIVNAGAAVTVIVIALLAELPASSVTSKVINALPAPVGVPVIAPVLLLKLKPKGSVPEVIVHRKGLVPPDSLITALYAVPAVAGGTVVVVIVGRGFTLICKEEVLVASVMEVAVMVTVNTLVTDAGAL
jgi:hypothetical protein